MVTYNKVLLMGTVFEEPEFTIDSERGDVLHIKLRVNRKDIGKTEFVTVAMFNDELLRRALSEIEVGDCIIITNARLITTNYTKVTPIVCPECQNVEYKQTKAEKTEIEVFNYELMKGLNEDSVVGINRVNVLGKVCSSLNFRPGANNGRDYIKYKLTVNRLGKQKKDKNADFPFIVSFNQDATYANEHLKPNATLLIEGAIQEREIVQKHQFHCTSCGYDNVSKNKSYVREVITSRVEYFNKTNSEEELEEKED